MLVKCEVTYVWFGGFAPFDGAALAAIVMCAEVRNSCKTFVLLNRSVAQFQEGIVEQTCDWSSRLS